MAQEVENNRISELSESQKTCLRLVRAGLTSKQIARQTNLSDMTVDQYISRAMTLLNVANRHVAAELLEKAESGAIKVSEFRPAALAEHDLHEPPVLLPVNAEQSEMDSVDEDLDRPNPSAKRSLKLFFGLPPVGGKRHDYDWTERTKAILRIAFAAIIGVSSLIVIVRGAIILLKP